MTFSLTQIDNLTRRDHSYLDEDDQCYFIGEYTARAGYRFSETNNIISNLKKEMDRRGRPEWRYKEQAIRRCGVLIRECFMEDALDGGITLVPVPPSKKVSDPMYDDRMRRILEHACRPYRNADVRELVRQIKSIPAFHESDDKRLPPHQLARLYAIDETVSKPVPGGIFVVDDLLTTGSHFKAMQKILGARFPSTSIYGLFIARRAPDSQLGDF